MSGDVDTFAALLVTASTFYVAGLATLAGAWYLEKLPPKPTPPEPAVVQPEPEAYHISLRF